MNFGSKKLWVAAGGGLFLTALGWKAGGSLPPEQMMAAVTNLGKYFMWYIAIQGGIDIIKGVTGIWTKK